MNWEDAGQYEDAILNKLDCIIALLEKMTAETELSVSATLEEKSFDEELIRMIHEEVERGFARIREGWVK